MPNGITLIMNNNGKCSGEGFVEFASQADVDKALKLDRNMIGKRLVVLFPFGAGAVAGFEAVSVWSNRYCFFDGLIKID